MRMLILFALGLSTASATFAQGTLQPAAQTVEIPSGSLRLKGLLWKPQGPGPFPAVVFNHGRSDTPQLHSRQLKLMIEDAAEVLGPVFVRHGFVFLYPFRRGEGLSANQGQFIGDVLQQEEKARGAESRSHLRTVLMTTDHLQDAQAALTFLKGLSYIDARRIAVAGHSFGGGPDFVGSLARQHSCCGGDVWCSGRIMGKLARVA